MRILYLFLFFAILLSCNQSEKIEYQELKLTQIFEDSIVVEEEPTPKVCNYLDYNYCGNLIYDTIKINSRIIDPIDDSLEYIKSIYKFYTKDDKVFRKARTHAPCNDELIDIEFFQNVTKHIDVESFQDIDGTFFSSKGMVFFWWANSSGHLIIPIEGADPNSFKPFNNICGGTDINGMYYGSPNFGVYKLDLPLFKKYKFYAKDDNYWNSPNHYLLLENSVYDVKYNYNDKYHLVINDSVRISDLQNSID